MVFFSSVQTYWKWNRIKCIRFGSVWFFYFFFQFRKLIPTLMFWKKSWDTNDTRISYPTTADIIRLVQPYNWPPLETSVIPNTINTHMPERTILLRVPTKPLAQKCTIDRLSTNVLLDFSGTHLGRPENNPHPYYDVSKSHTFISWKVETMTSPQLLFY